jgi:hypothetical protein
MDGQTVRKVAAAVLALIALLLAAITVSAIISGADGMLVIVVGATGSGAVLLGLIAAWLWFGSRPDYEPVLSSVRSRHRTGHKFPARPATRAAEPMPAPPPVSQIQPAAPSSPTVRRLHARDLPVCDYTPPPPRAVRTPGQRRILLGLGLLILFSGVHDIRTGKAKLSPKGKATDRAQQPFAFWALVALQLGVAGALLSVAAREAMAARRQRGTGG